MQVLQKKHRSAFPTHCFIFSRATYTPDTVTIIWIFPDSTQRRDRQKGEAEAREIEKEGGRGRGGVGGSKTSYAAPGSTRLLPPIDGAPPRTRGCWTCVSAYQLSTRAKEGAERQSANPGAVQLCCCFVSAPVRQIPINRAVLVFCASCCCNCSELWRLRFSSHTPAPVLRVRRVCVV